MKQTGSVVKISYTTELEFHYLLISNTERYITMQDTDGTSMRYDKQDHTLSQFNPYESQWQLMGNATAILDKVEIM